MQVWQSLGFEARRTLLTVLRPGCLQGRGVFLSRVSFFSGRVELAAGSSSSRQLTRTNSIASVTFYGRGVFHCAVLGGATQNLAVDLNPGPITNNLL